MNGLELEEALMQLSTQTKIELQAAISCDRAEPDRDDSKAF